MDDSISIERFKTCAKAASFQNCSYPGGTSLFMANNSSVIFSKLQQTKMFKIRKSDMDPQQTTFVLDSANIIKDRESSRDPELFLSDLKHILDSRFGGDWNLLTGRSVGYAMKTRKKASFVLTSPSNEILIGWRSPGLEVEDVEIVKVKTKLSLSDKDELLQSDATGKSRLKVISVPSPDTPGYSSNTPLVLRILDGLVDDIKEMENDAAARHIRNQYACFRFSCISYIASLLALVLSGMLLLVALVNIL